MKLRGKASNEDGTMVVRFLPGALLRDQRNKGKEQALNLGALCVCVCAGRESV